MRHVRAADNLGMHCRPSAATVAALDATAFAGMLALLFGGQDPRFGRASGIWLRWRAPGVTRFSHKRMKRQYQPSKIRRKRQHGFLARMSTAADACPSTAGGAPDASA